MQPTIKEITGNNQLTKVDSFWSKNIVKAIPFATAWESEYYFKWLIKEYPLLDEFMDFFKNREDQVILDYGCGPGNDLFRFTVINNAEKVIGLDISHKVLKCAQKRLELHAIDPKRVELIKIYDLNQRIPLSDNSVDHLNCAGVLQHTSNPQMILSEFFRVLKKNTISNIMVYTYDSLWLHLYVAYEIMILKNKFSNFSIKEAFSKNTDGENCPISRCYQSKEFITMCNLAGFKAEFIGGYLSRNELYCYRKFKDKALKDPRLAEEHKNFLNSLKEDVKGYPKYNGKYAGVSGVYKIYKN